MTVWIFNLLLLFAQKPLKHLGFEKIIFQTTTCMGSCPAISLEICNNKTVKLIISSFTGGIGAIPDSANSGYFEGRLADSVLYKLSDEVKRTKLNAQNFSGQISKDASVITVVVFNQKMIKYFAATYIPEGYTKVIEIFKSIADPKKVPRTTVRFKIERFEKGDLPFHPRF